MLPHSHRCLWVQRRQVECLSFIDVSFLYFTYLHPKLLGGLKKCYKFLVWDGGSLVTTDYGAVDDVEVNAVVAGVDVECFVFHNGYFILM